MASSNGTAVASVTTPSLFTLTFLVLLVLKLTGTNISWWWVFAPLLVSCVLTLVFVTIVILALLNK